MNQGSAKKVKTVRFDDMELERIRSADHRHCLRSQGGLQVVRYKCAFALYDGKQLSI